MESERIVNVYTAVILILSITPSSIVILRKTSLKRLSTGLMSLIVQTLIQVQKSYFSEFLTAQDHLAKNSTTPFYLCYYIYKRKLNEEALLLQDFIKRIKQNYIFEKDVSPSSLISSALALT